MELRFLEVNGEKRLQYKKQIAIVNGEQLYGFTDVPTVKEEKKVWCEHIRWQKLSWTGKNNLEGWYIHGGGWGLQPTTETMFCPICGTPRPKEA